MPDTLSHPTPQDLLSFTDALRETVLNPWFVEYAEAVRGSDVEAYLTIWDNLPDPPLVAEARMVFRGESLAANLSMFPHKTNKEQRLDEVWGTTTSLVGIVSGYQHLHAEIKTNTIASAGVIGKLLPVVEAGRYQSIARKLDQVGDTVENGKFIRILTPVALLQTAYIGLIEITEANLSPAESALPQREHDELVVERVDAYLQEACSIIMRGEPLPPRRKSDSTAEQTVAGALEALRRCYNIGESETDKASLVEPLLSLRIESIVRTREMNDDDQPARVSILPNNKLQAGQSSIDVMTLIGSASTRISRAFTALGISIDPEFVRDVPSMYERNAIRRPAGRENFLIEVNRVHTQVIMRGVARAFVGGIAEGDFGYARIQQIGSQLHTKPLGIRAEEVAKQQAAELERQAADARAKEAEILAQIERAVDQLMWEVLPRGESETSEPRAARSADGQAEQHERHLEPRRLAALLELQDGWPYPGVRMFRSRLGQKVVSAENKGQDREEYYVLVLPEIRADGSVVLHAVAECAKNDNALFILRGDLYDGIDWNDVFSQSKPYAKRTGALDLHHPPQKSYDTDPLGTMNRFLDRIVEHLAIPVGEFRSRWLARTAVATTVDRPGSSA